MFFLKKYFKNKKEKKAFFLIEVMLAIFLVLVGFLAIILLATSGLRESMDSRDQIIAGLLAQEGAELVRNIRDNNWVATPFVDSFDNFPNNANKERCIIDMNNGGAINNSDCRGNTTSDDFILDHSGGYYVKNDGTASGDTKFRRKVGFNETSNKLTVTSMVAWGGSFQTIANCTTVNKCVYVRTILTEWGKPN